MVFASAPMASSMERKPSNSSPRGRACVHPTKASRRAEASRALSHAVDCEGIVNERKNRILHAAILQTVSIRADASRLWTKFGATPDACRFSSRNIVGSRREMLEFLGPVHVLLCLGAGGIDNVSR